MSDSALDAQLAHALFMQWVFVWILLAGAGLASAATCLRLLVISRKQSPPADKIK